MSEGSEVTNDSFPTTAVGRLIEVSKIFGALSAIVLGSVGMWAVTIGPAAEFLKSVDGVIVGFDEMKDDVDKLQDAVQRISTIADDVATLKADVARANGEDRVIRQPQGLSYIKEPVVEGENVTMFMVAARTRLGADCRLTDWTPIFQDERNIPTPGGRARAGPVARQIDTDLQTLRIEMVPPAGMRPGRITVYLTLTYACPGVSTPVPDRTDTLAYELLPRRE
jgi:hypothetical protein